MRDEIEKLIAELRTTAQGTRYYGEGVAQNAADRLQAILNDSEAESSALSDSKESDKLDTDYVAKDSQLGCSCLCHEQDPVARLAEIGRLVEELALHTRCFTNDYDDSGLYIEVGIPSGGITLLDALEALKERCG